MYCLPYSTYVTYFPGGRRRKRREWRKIKRSRQQKQQATTTTSTSTSRYLLPFLRITVSVAWYIYLTVCEMYMQCRSKKIIISRSINYYTIPSTYMYLHQHAHLTLPHLTFSFSPYPYLPNKHLPIPDPLFSLSLTISGLSPPTYLPTYPPTLPYPSIPGIQCPAFLFLCLPCIIYIHTYIHTYFPFYQPSLPLGRYPPTLPNYFSYLPAQPSSVPTCLPVLSRMLYVVCVGNDDDEKEYFVGR